MEVIETGFTGLVVIRPVIHADRRGYFIESYNNAEFLNAGIKFNPVQDNESKSSKGVIRGLHYQLKPSQQSKLVRVVEGRIFDVALDLRRDSATFGKWFGIGLDSESKEQLFIPGGFAHGFSVLSDSAIILYKVDALYDKNSERGISVMDPELAIDWHLGNADPVISEKDLNAPLFRNAEFNF
jgi:dTDP-4-dehydrorhamnose 3,5-epimerase